MYLPAISIIIVGVVLFILNSLILFWQYKENLTKPRQKKKLSINGLFLGSSLGVIVLGIVEVFLINNQLS